YPLSLYHTAPPPTSLLFPYTTLFRSQVKVFDTKAASVGEGLLVLEAVRLKNEGKTLEENLEWLENNYLKLHSWVTVDDLKHLERDRKSTRLNSSHVSISYAVFCLKKK